MERLTVTSAKRPEVKYDFGKDFYKFSAYYRRAAIAEALGCVSSYLSRIKNWESEDIRTRGRKPSLPRAGFTSPALYRKNCYIRETDYTASIKVWVNNTWDWVTADFRKSDADYILKHCSGRKEYVPVLRKRAGNGIWTFLLRKKQNFMIHRQRTSWSLQWTLASTTHVPAVCLQRTARSCSNTWIHQVRRKGPGNRGYTTGVRSMYSPWWRIRYTVLGCVWSVSVHGERQGLEKYYKKPVFA